MQGCQVTNHTQHNNTSSPENLATIFYRDLGQQQQQQQQHAPERSVPIRGTNAALYSEPQMYVWGVARWTLQFWKCLHMV